MSSRFFLFLSIAFGLASIVVSVSDVFSPRAGQPTLPLEVDQEVIDLGEVPDGRNASAEFRLRNGSDDTLYILHVIPSCLCTSASLDNRSLLPGGVAMLRVGVVAERSDQTVTRTVVLQYTGDKERGLKTVTLSVRYHKHR